MSEPRKSAEDRHDALNKSEMPGVASATDPDEPDAPSIPEMQVNRQTGNAQPPIRRKPVPAAETLNIRNPTPLEPPTRFPSLRLPHPHATHPDALRTPLPQEERISVESRDESPERAPTQGVIAETSHARHDSAQVPEKLHHHDCVPWWNPFWLSAIYLACVLILFLVLIIVLQLLRYVSNTHSGFDLITQNYYTWTFGPTAVLVICAELWWQVDYWCKSLQPWENLRKGPQPAANSVLLDHVSPLLPVIWWNSFRQKHFLICMTILALLLLKIVTVVSTGLFASEITVIAPKPVSVKGKTGLDISKPIFTLSKDAQSSSVVYNAFAYLAAGLPYPEGMTADSVYETLDASAFAEPNSTVSARVDSFWPSLQCETATFTYSLPPFGPQYTMGQLNFNGSTLSCGEIRGSMPIKNPGYQSCPPRQLSGYYQSIGCNGEYADEKKLTWLLFVLLDMRYNQTLAPGVVETPNKELNSSSVTSYSGQVGDLMGVACNSTYALHEAEVTYDYTSQPAKITVNPLWNEHVRQFVQTNVSTLWMGSMVALENAFSSFGDITTDDLALDYPDPMFGLMSTAIGKPYEALLDPAVLAATANRTVKALWNQLVTQHILTPLSKEINGTFIIHENRLFVATAPLWIMTASFIIQVGITIYVVLFRPRDATPCDMTSISGAARILSYSPNLQSFSKEASNLAQSQMETHFHDRSYCSVTNDATGGAKVFTLVADTPVGVKKEPATRSPGNFKYWRPIMSHWAVIVSTLGLPLCIVAALEVIQTLNDRYDGIGTLDRPGNLATLVVTRFVPASLLLLVATLYSSLSFTSTIMAPWAAIRRKPATASRSIQLSLVGSFPLLRLWRAVHSIRLGAASSIAASIIGATLTIIASGLYTTDLVSIPTPLTLRRLDYFDTDWRDSVQNDNFTALLSSVIETSPAFTYPQYTYDQIAVPHMELSSTTALPNQFIGTGITALVRLPVFRAALKCEFIPRSDYNYTMDWSGWYGDAAVYLSAQASLPAQCLKGGPGGNLSYITWSFEWQGTPELSYVGGMTDLHMGPYDLIEGSSYDETFPGMKDNPPGCPSLAFSFGHFEVDEANYHNNGSMTSMICYQYLQELEANVTFLIPSFQIDISSPPVPDESTVRYLPAESSNQTAFWFRLQNHFANQLSMFNDKEYNPNPGVIAGFMPNFYQAILFGRTPVRQSDLVGPVNRERLFNATNAFYARYMAQAISRNMRVIKPSNIEELYNATYLDHSTYRVHQSGTAKLILQIMLSIMFVLGVLTYWLSDLRTTLTHNPCSIAGTMSLLAGSEMCRPGRVGIDGEAERRVAIGPEIQWMTEREVNRLGLWEGKKFKLGWWDECGPVSGGTVGQVGGTSTGDQAGAGGGRTKKRRWGVEMMWDHN